MQVSQYQAEEVSTSELSYIVWVQSRHEGEARYVHIIHADDQLAIFPYSVISLAVIATVMTCLTTCYSILYIIVQIIVLLYHFEQ